MVGRGPRKCTFQLQAARNKDHPYNEEYNQYLIALLLGEDIDGNDLVDDEFDETEYETKYSMDNELPSDELLQRVRVTVSKVTRVNNPSSPRCSMEECTNPAVVDGLCITHGATKKTCSFEGCNNQARNGGVCITHGATKKTCSFEGCNNQAQKGGVCITHGATKKTCSFEGCTMHGAIVTHQNVESV
jgi:hypothetical protein